MRTARSLSLLAIATLALSLGACASSQESTAPVEAPPAAEQNTDTADAETDAFPVTIEHAYGETVIEAKPERVATVAWANHEVPLALGIVPVGMSKATWGDDDDNGVLPWVEDKLAELDAEIPVLFDETAGIDFEAVGDTNPDVILAAYSGITEDEYATLSKIAPVVAFPDTAWGTTMAQMIEMNSKALGLGAEGQQFAADLDTKIAESFAQYPALQDSSVLFAWVEPTDLSEVGFYTTHDPRVGFLATAGMAVPSLVTEATAGTDSFYTTVASEQADQFEDVDIIVTYGDDTTLPLLQGDSLLSKVPAIADGAVVVLPDNTPLSASANPSPLSIEWGIGDYFALLDEAAQAAA
ncbi:iron complex transport system substrate-binding protein [Micrococcales bacterium KH10]|nr:iron complex transport system substrate-binding protein [Micrococcales bacterium KH10]